MSKILKSLLGIDYFFYLSASVSFLALRNLYTFGIGILLSNVTVFEDPIISKSRGVNIPVFMNHVQLVKKFQTKYYKKKGNEILYITKLNYKT